MEKNQTELRANPKSVSVAASPFNPVKFALAIVLCLALVLWLLLSIFTSNILVQIIVLLSYSILSSIFLVILTRYVLKQQTLNK